MKFTEELMGKMTERRCRDTFWKDVYENAPEGARRRLRVAFWASYALDEREDLDAYRAYREQVEREMTYEDAVYLAEHFIEGPGKEHYKELAGNLQFRSLKTDEKLDEAMDIMTEGWTTEDREAFRKSREAFRNCTDALVKYEWLWSAVGGNGENAELVGDVFDHGHGVERDEDLAFFWFRRGALCGDGDSCYRLAHLYEDAKSKLFDMTRALFWLREGLRRNCLEVKIRLGQRLTLSEDEAWKPYRNPKLGVALLESALPDDKKKDGLAHLFLAECYEKGIGVPEDLYQAVRLYGLSRDNGMEGVGRHLQRVRRKIRQRKGNDRP